MKNVTFFLRVEAGTDGLGPTYNLHFKIDTNGVTRAARHSDELSKIFLVPEVGMGMYDDFDDDLGVPWAFPLAAFVKINPHEIDSFGVLFFKLVFFTPSEIAFPAWNKDNKPQIKRFFIQLILPVLFIGIGAYLALNYL